MSQGTLHPPKARLVLRVGITGHRPDKLGSDTEVVGAKVRAVLTAIKEVLDAVDAEARQLGCYRDEPPLMRIISALAEGADRLAADEAVALDGELQVVLPFAQDEYKRDFAEEASKKKFGVLLARATAVMTLDGTRAAEERAYRAAGLMMLRQCDVVIAVWDGKRPVSTAGTGAIADDALRLGLPGPLRRCSAAAGGARAGRAVPPPDGARAGGCAAARARQRRACAHAAEGGWLAQILPKRAGWSASAGMKTPRWRGPPPGPIRRAGWRPCSMPTAASPVACASGLTFSLRERKRLVAAALRPWPYALVDGTEALKRALHRAGVHAALIWPRSSGRTGSWAGEAAKRTRKLGAPSSMQSTLGRR